MTLISPNVCDHPRTNLVCFVEKGDSVSGRHLEQFVGGMLLSKRIWTSALCTGRTRVISWILTNKHLRGYAFETLLKSKSILRWGDGMGWESSYIIEITDEGSAFREEQKQNKNYYQFLMCLHGTANCWPKLGNSLHAETVTRLISDSNILPQWAAKQPAILITFVFLAEGGKPFRHHTTISAAHATAHI